MTPFEQAKLSAMLQLQQRAGIGQYKEYSLHAVFKHLMQPDGSFHEQKIAGYVADAVDGDRIIEIQTGNFYGMSKKLSVFLREHPVTVVYPLIEHKRIVWVDPESGETAKPKLSPKKGRFTDALPELCWISDIIRDHGNFELWLVLVDVEEYRLTDGWGKDRKNRYTRVERIPTALGEELVFRAPADYRRLMPPMPETFTQKDFSAATGLRGMKLSRAVRFCCNMGLCGQTGKRGNAFLYEVKDE